MVWDQWHERKSEKDLVIKMNTGGGKTTVGLILLQSCLNDKMGPAVFVTPNKHLTEQAIQEAKALGLPVTDDTNDERFKSGQSILIANVYKLVNGMSVFGVEGGYRASVNLGAIVFDDAHACHDTIESQFSLTIPRENTDLYNSLFKLYATDLQEQNPTKIQEILEGAPNRSMLLPFWSWRANLNATIELLVQNRELDILKFQYPLVADHLRQCSCVISESGIEITPHVVPISKIPSIFNAGRRIFMSATLADDGALSSHFAVSHAAISKPIVPISAGDVGDRLFITPSLIDSNSSREEVKALLKRMSRHYNTVVIVPSASKATFWEDVADVLLQGTAVEAGIQKLRSQHVGLAVLVNRYDGIDLPDDACRILVLDDLPDVRRQIDTIRQGYLQGSDKVRAQVAQRVEQGAGRGIRSADDFCAVFLMGSNLCAQVHTSGIREKFSPATRKQFELSDSVTEQLSEVSQIENVVVNEFMNRASQWATFSRQAVTALKYENPEPDVIAVGFRDAFDCADRGDIGLAVQSLRNLVTSLSDPIETGFARQMLAEYLDYEDEVLAQTELLKAKKENASLLRPIAGISVSKKSEPESQSLSCQQFLKGHFPTGNHLIVAITDLLEGLVFDDRKVPLFEESMKKLSFYLGFEGQRPEKETGRGPDVTWSLGKSKHLVIECKSGSTSDKIYKKDSSQLNTSAAWFRKEFDKDSIGYPVMIHQVRTLEYEATLDSDAMIIDFNKFEELKSAVRDFARSVSRPKEITVDEIKERLDRHHLSAGRLLSKFLQKPIYKT